MATPVGFCEISVEHVHAQDPEPWFNVFGVACDLSLNSQQEVVDHVAGVFYAMSVPALSASVTLANVTGRFGQDGSPDVIVETSVAPLNGTSTDVKLPQNCALMVRKQTALGGRQGRGRIFLPGWLNESGVNDVGIIENNIRQIYQTTMDDFLADLAAPDPVSGAETPMVILHGPTTTSNVVRAPTPVTSLTVDGRISTQRRRLR